MREPYFLYRPEADIGYSVQLTNILLFHLPTGKTCLLNYPQAAVWDLLLRKYPLTKIITILSNILQITRSQAAAIIESLLEELVEKGFLQRETIGG